MSAVGICRRDCRRDFNNSLFECYSNYLQKIFAQIWSKLTIVAANLKLGMLIKVIPVIHIKKSKHGKLWCFSFCSAWNILCPYRLKT